MLKGIWCYFLFTRAEYNTISYILHVEYQQAKESQEYEMHLKIKPMSNMYINGINHKYQFKRSQS